MDQVPLRTGWIKAWIAFGSVVFVCVVVLPPILLYAAAQDVQRYRDCAANKRRDCQRTIVWNLVDIAAQLQAADGGDSLSGISGYGVDNNSDVTPPSRTSENAPNIDKVEPRGMANANGTYRAAVGASVTFVATISNNPVTVEGFLITDASIPTKAAVVFTKQKDGTWQGVYKIPSGLKGEMEIRATGDDPKDRASLYLLVAAN